VALAFSVLVERKNQILTDVKENYLEALVRPKKTKTGERETLEHALNRIIANIGNGRATGVEEARRGTGNTR
jgi:hypothetical protein